MGVPHASEEFRDYLFWTDLAENARRYWVGDAPRLTIADGDERYGRVETDSGAFTCVTVTLAPFDLTPTTVMSMQVRTLGATADTFELFFANSTGSNYVFLDIESGTSWQTISGPIADFSGWTEEQAGLVATAAAGELVAGVLGPLGVGTGYGVSWIDVGVPTVEGRLAIDTHDHPFHVVGTRDPAMPYELVIDTGTQRLVEIVAGEESLATHELVIDETGRPGDPWTHCGLFRPV